MKHYASGTHEDDILFKPKQQSVVNMHEEKFDKDVQEEVNEALKRIDYLKRTEGVNRAEIRQKYEPIIKVTLSVIEGLNQKTTKGLNPRNFALIEKILREIENVSM